MNSLSHLHFTSADGRVSVNENGEMKFTAQSPAKRTAFTFSAAAEIPTEDFFVLEYRCLGWLRPSVYRQPFITACDRDGNVLPLVCYDDITADGRRYTVAVKIGRHSISSLSLTLYTGHRPESEFTVCGMYFCTEAELPLYCAGDVTAEAGNYTVIDLSSRYNRHFSPDANDVRLGGGRFFDCKEITLHGIPFQINTVGNNCISPPPPPAENEDIIENFGVKARRRVCRPVSRDSETVIDLHKNATELFFLLSIEGKRYQRCGFATGGTILGQSGSEVTLPLFVLFVIVPESL